MNLILVGMMGSGKTSVGKRLARRLGYRFLDTDHYIEANTGQTIAEMFAEHGEAHFRELEARLAARLHKLDNYVLATGGGFLTPEGNLERVKAAGVTVFLNAMLEDILKRLQHDRRRPKVQGGDLQETITTLFQERLPLYSQSDITVDTRGKTAYRVAGEIIRRIGEARRGATKAG